ncbi:DUF4389 domain-containing protein [Streptacidiphilus pinicola]|uniref:DUF4389 domain-containing protein n=1 Tax=Streptacidiphilus pinicola TaxID=2219663 RepID=A0A2X0IC18_9ACTN|nr:DUF4389 domain-containing protein [Streptacidiphilus pinicola]RAG82502.1 DUF4389 domain-containing protein [Streptacidiphilus pinicola]
MAQQQLWAPPPPMPNGEVLPELDVPAPAAQRRWTVLLRWLLAIPHYIVLAVLGFVGFFVVVAGWFAALVLGRLPGPIARYLTGLLIYQTRVSAYSMLLVDQYPPFAFDAPGYTVQVDVRPAELNRLAVLFRLILMIPAGIVQSLVTTGWYVVALVIWIVTLVLGRLPEPAFGATAATVRFAMRFGAYASMLTAAYPKRLFGDESLALAERRSASRPLLLSTGAKVLVVVFLVLGLANSAWSSAVNSGNNSNSTTATTGAGPAH